MVCGRRLYVGISSPREGAFLSVGGPGASFNKKIAATASPSSVATLTPKPTPCV